MNQFFEGLASQNNAEVTSVVTQDNFTLRAGGYVTITKGIVSINISYWSDVFKSNYPGYALNEDMDWDILDTHIGGVKIDSLSKFNEGLTNMGLSSVSSNINIKDDDIKSEILKCIEASDVFQSVFKGLKLFNCLSRDEQKKIVLEYSILNYDKANSYTLNRYGLSESSNTKPSLEELLTLKKQML
jgi:hypothetical protein